MSRTSLTGICVALLGCMAFGVSSAAAQTVWYVDDDGPNDPGPGDPDVSDPLEDGSADHPFDAIQEGIDAAVNGDTVLVADGTYAGLGNRDIDFEGKLITVRSVDGPSGCHISCGGEGIGFHFHNAETFDAVLEGFRITGAHVTGYYSGAVVCDGASPTINQCRIATSDGAGLFCRYGAPTVFDCDIWQNSAQGLNCWRANLTLAECSIYENAEDGIFCDQGSIEMTSCTVSENAGFGVYSDDGELLMASGWVSENGYGGIYCDGGNSTIDGCTISDNFYIIGAGAGIIIADGNATISRCTITWNLGDLWGGVVYWGGNLDISDCVIAHNIAVENYGFAAGLVVGYGDVRVSNCAITGNVGGFFGGGIYVEEVCVAVYNSVVANNDSMGWGGAIYCEFGADVTFTNCTIVENTAADKAGALWFLRGNATFVNSIVRDNWAPDGPPFVIYGNHDLETVLTVSHCNVEDGEAAFELGNYASLVWGPGNIDADPLFVDPGESDYRLAAGSPCIDAGCNCGVPDDATDADGDGDTNEYTPFDLDGEGRFFDDPNTPDTGSGWPPVVDMGTYEFGDSELPPCRGDVDGDLDVDLADLTILLGNYGMTGGATGTDGDMNCDGDVGLHDLAQLLAVYGSTSEG